MLDSTSQPSLGESPVPILSEAHPFDRRQQVLQTLLGDSELLLKNRLEVRHLMTRDPVVIPPTTTLEEMTLLVQQRRLHHLLVCGRTGELLGVISDRDLHGQPGATAQQLMSYPVLSVTPETLLSPAITYLLNENISCLPVVEQGRPCGVLTMTDLVLILQCSLQLWVRLAQVLQHDTTWTKELDEMVAGLDDSLTAAELKERIARSRQAIERHVHTLTHTIDLNADVPTGMSNRRGLEEVLGMLLAVKRRFEQPLSLVVVMIDHFPRIRETCGDAVVGPLLRAVARLVEKSARDSDFVARYRDDAFVVVMPQTGLEEAQQCCVKLREAARRTAELDIAPRISAEAVLPEPGEDATQLLARAEAAIRSE